MTLQLRPYQQKSVDAIWDFFACARGNPLVVLPTGAGKSLVLSEICQRAIREYPTTRIIVVTHVKELVAQNFQELIGQWPEAPVGIYSAGLRKRQTMSQILFCSIQSVAKRVKEIGFCDLLIVDEAHLIPRSSTTLYGQFLADLREINEHCKIIGLTATPYRMDSGMMHQGKGALFDDIAYEAPVGELIDEGYLCPVTTARTTAKIDVSGVGKRGGEYIASQLQDAANIEEINRAIVMETIAASEGRKGWLIFASGVDHAEALAVLFREQGIGCGVVHGASNGRDELIRRFKAQDLIALASMNVLTTGFNAKHVDLIVLCRPTQSTGLYVQIVGRGLRTYPGKENCLVLDFAQNIERHGPIDDLNLNTKEKGDGEGEAPVKDCPQCKEAVHAAARICPECGFKFPEPEEGNKLDKKASNAAILKRDQDKVPPEWGKVSRVNYVRHEKAGKPPSMRVDYFHGMNVTREWVCFEHTGYARSKAESWWIQRNGAKPFPQTVADAIERASAGEVEQPSAVAVRLNGKYREIVDYDFTLSGESTDLNDLLGKATG